MSLRHVLLATTISVMGLPAAGQDWSGVSIGASIGYGSGTYRQVDDEGAEGVDVDVKDRMFGIQFTRQFQRDNSVFGFDAGLFSGIDGLTPEGTVGNPFICATGDCTVDIKALFTLRGRYGVLIGGRTLAYGAAGLAVGSVEGGIQNSSYLGSSTAVGYTLGMGLEYQQSDRVSLFAEASYFDLGDLEFGETGVQRPFLGDGDFSTIRVGVNYGF
jgi:outer membrane immunogenic protein